MSRPDPIAAAALEGDIAPVFFVYMDINTAPLRANTSGRDWPFSTHPDPDISGFTFMGVNSQFASISPIKQASGASDSVTAVLSGIPGLDDDMLALVGNPANWRNRICRLWRMIRTMDGAEQGALQHYFTGYMSPPIVDALVSTQTITVRIESYVASHSEPSNRTYMTQYRYDPGDLSDRATTAIVNGNGANPLTAGTPTNSIYNLPSGGGLFR